MTLLLIAVALMATAILISAASLGFIFIWFSLFKLGKFGVAWLRKHYPNLWGLLKVNSIAIAPFSFCFLGVVICKMDVENMPAIILDQPLEELFNLLKEGRTLLNPETSNWIFRLEARGVDITPAWVNEGNVAAAVLRDTYEMEPTPELFQAHYTVFNASGEILHKRNYPAVAYERVNGLPSCAKLIVPLELSPNNTFCCTPECQTLHDRDVVVIKPIVRNTFGGILIDLLLHKEVVMEHNIFPS